MGGAVRLLTNRLLFATCVGFLAPKAEALPSNGANCSTCHSTPRGGMALGSFQTTTNLGAGVLKVFKVTAGQTATISLSVTNDYGGDFGLALVNLNNGGITNPTNRLAYTADAAWTSQFSGSYFTIGPISGAPQTLSFRLSILTNTPAGFYMPQALMTGLDNDYTMWSQRESFYLEVLPAAPLTAPAPTLLAVSRAGGKFSLQASTVSGFTYYLEYKSSLSSTTWNSVVQIPGDGTVKTFTDAGVLDSMRFYRLRVQ